MRASLAVLLLLLAGCHEDAPTRGEYDSVVRSMLAIGEEQRAMRAALGGVDHEYNTPEMLARLDAMEARLAAMQAAVQNFQKPKAPTLLAYAGTNKEMNLGEGSWGTRCARNPIAKAEVCFLVGPWPFFDGADCSGEALIEITTKTPTVFYAADGAIYDRMRDTVEVPSRSRFTDVGCINFQAPTQRQFAPLTRLASLPIFASEDLSVDLR